MSISDIKDAETLVMIEEIVGRAALAAERTVNLGLEEILKRSLKEVPKGDNSEHEKRVARGKGYPAKTLAESGRVVPAKLPTLTGQVVYESPYAAAQEAGVMPFAGPEGEIAWEKNRWEAESYTTEGTKSHYLEDPAKAVMGALSEELGFQARIAFEEIPGPITAKSTLQTTGLRETQVPPPSGSLAAASQHEASQAAQATSFTVPTAPPQLQ